MTGHISDVSKKRNEKELDTKKQSKRCVAEIDLACIERNFLLYKKSLPRDFEMIAVVKADAYGHGAVPIARKLSALGVNAFAVATLDEGIELRRNGISGEILILGYSSPKFAKEIYNHGLTQTLVDRAYAEELAATTDKRLKVQYAIDTGMKRIGLDGTRPIPCEKEIRRVAKIFQLNGIFTHLASADGAGIAERKLARLQIERFAEIAKRVNALELPFVHCLNTAGGITYSDLPPNIGKFVRLGIALYGLAPSKDIALPEGICPALSWYTSVASVRSVKKGESVGYGSDCVMSRNCIIATLTVGYADGYSRAASSGRAYVLINGKRAPVVGRVCMDQIMVDVTSHEHIRAGDRAVLIGRSGNGILTADMLGQMIGTVGYEIVCNVSPRVERKYR